MYLADQLATVIWLLNRLWKALLLLCFDIPDFSLSFSWLQLFLEKGPGEVLSPIVCNFLGLTLEYRLFYDFSILGVFLSGCMATRYFWWLSMLASLDKVSKSSLISFSRDLSSAYSNDFSLIACNLKSLSFSFKVFFYCWINYFNRLISFWWFQACPSKQTLSFSLDFTKVSTVFRSSVILAAALVAIDAIISQLCPSSYNFQTSKY